MNPLSEETETQMTKQTLTESEVQQEIQDFNLQIQQEMEDTNLKKKTIQQMDLKIEQTRNQIHDLDQGSKDMASQKDTIIQQNQHIDTRIKQLINQINTKIAAINQNQQLDSNCNESILTTNQNDEDQNDTSSFNSYAKQLKSNLDLITFIYEQKEKMNRIRKCQNCMIQYCQLDSDKKSCVYHAGKIKYFSCKGCGRDDYYQCCFMCEDCSKGCRQGYHVPVQ